MTVVVTLTSPAASVLDREEKVAVELAPGLRRTIVRFPRGAETSTRTAFAPTFFTWTITIGLLEAHRVDTAVVTFDG